MPSKDTAAMPSNQYRFRRDMFSRFLRFGRARLRQRPERQTLGALTQPRSPALPDYTCPRVVKRGEKKSHPGISDAASKGNHPCLGRPLTRHLRR